MKKEKLKEKYIKYELTQDDVFRHQHYIIITRSGIEKIQGIEKITIYFEVIKSDINFASVKAIAMKDGKTIETFGSAKKGVSYKDGNTTSWYVLEMAEKRALSRAVLKMTGFYELGVFSEDESEEFKQNNN